MPINMLGQFGCRSPPHVRVKRSKSSTSKSIEKCCKGAVLFVSIIQMISGMVLAALHVVLIYVGKNASRDLQTPLPVYITAVLSSMAGLLGTVVIKVHNSCIILLTVFISMCACVVALTGLMFASSVAIPKYSSFTHFSYYRDTKQCIAYTIWDLDKNGTYSGGTVYDYLSSCSIIESTLPPLGTALVYLYGITCAVCFFSSLFQGLVFCMPAQCFEHRDHGKSHYRSADLDMGDFNRTTHYPINRNNSRNIRVTSTPVRQTSQCRRCADTRSRETTFDNIELSPIRRPGPVTISATVAERKNGRRVTVTRNSSLRASLKRRMATNAIGKINHPNVKSPPSSSRGSCSRGNIGRNSSGCAELSISGRSCAPRQESQVLNKLKKSPVKCRKNSAKLSRSPPPYSELPNYDDVLVEIDSTTVV